MKKEGIMMRMTSKEAKEFIVQSVKSDVDMTLVVDAIKALEQEPRWIPVSDHTPDYGLDVLVSVDMGSECAVGIDMYSAVEKEGFEGYGKAVLAWMSLPEPYNKVESEESKE